MRRRRPLPPLREPAFRAVGAGNFRLLESVSAPDHARRRFILIPAGRVTDFASSPRVMWRVVDRMDCGTLAPLVHDELYRHGGRVHTWPTARPYTRAEADALFYALMRRQRVPAWRAALAYLGVRLGGASSWRAPSDDARVNAALRAPHPTPERTDA